MSGFLDKLKNGFAEAGNKAKQMVDVNRLKLQISQEELEMREMYRAIGEKVFELYQTNDLNRVAEAVEEECRNILRKQEELRELETKVFALNDEKECPSCKTVAERSIRYCPECGFRFEEFAEDAEAGEETGMK